VDPESPVIAPEVAEAAFDELVESGAELLDPAVGLLLGQHAGVHGFVDELERRERRRLMQLLSIIVSEQRLASGGHPRMDEAPSAP
jgi:hypothetical protein